MSEDDKKDTQDNSVNNPDDKSIEELLEESMKHYQEELHLKAHPYTAKGTLNPLADMPVPEPDTPVPDLSTFMPPLHSDLSIPNPMTITMSVAYYTVLKNEIDSLNSDIISLKTEIFKLKTEIQTLKDILKLPRR